MGKDIKDNDKGKAKKHYKKTQPVRLVNSEFMPM